MTTRFAVLGCGRIGKMHAEMLARQVPGASVSVVFDVVEAAAQALRDSTMSESIVRHITEQSGEM